MTIFGLTFEFPVVLISLELARVVTPARLLRSWRWAVIIIVVISAVFTPSSDPFSMFALALPLIGLYVLRVRTRRVIVPTLMFWDRTFDRRRERFPWHRFRHLASLLLQLLHLTFHFRSLFFFALDIDAPPDKFRGEPDVLSLFTDRE